MTQKMVIDVSMSNGRKSYSRALKIVAGFEGVQKAGLGEKDKNQIEVVADQGVDPIKITTSLRKKMEKRNYIIGCFLGKCRVRTHAELISVTRVDEKKEEKKIEWPMPPATYYVPQCIEYGNPNPCAIM